jgi:hypothetical protein
MTRRLVLLLVLYIGYSHAQSGDNSMPTRLPPVQSTVLGRFNGAMVGYDDDHINVKDILIDFYTYSSALLGPRVKTNITHTTVESTAAFGGEEADVRAGIISASYTTSVARPACSTVDEQAGICPVSMGSGMENGLLGSSLASDKLLLITSTEPHKDTNISVTLRLAGNPKESHSCQVRTASHHNPGTNGY